MTFLVVPPAHRATGPGVHWRVPPTAKRRLTEAPRLHAALRLAVEHTPGAVRPEGAPR
ncbi:hypothetical protein RKE29_01760 [Streptomyces sp. B1866]|uniref:hypothetical protein n=1 Tax=Streptomyces sp. B1866 TaxID=3075431 RepID=UPI00288F8876|nr:hypothetical protein [Streptomyces sp. B1866]MDT3395385.1 hypothetical protein [Streptomyces sp. B1866]